MLALVFIKGIILGIGKKDLNWIITWIKIPKETRCTENSFI